MNRSQVKTGRNYFYDIKDGKPGIVLTGEITKEEIDFLFFTEKQKEKICEHFVSIGQDLISKELKQNKWNKWADEDIAERILNMIEDTKELKIDEMESKLAKIMEIMD